jgi:hypothetical protein
MYTYIGLKLLYFMSDTFDKGCWDSAHLLPYGFSVHIYYYSITIFSTLNRPQPQIITHETQIFT